VTDSRDPRRTCLLFYLFECAFSPLFRPPHRPRPIDILLLHFATLLTLANPLNRQSDHYHGWELRTSSWYCLRSRPILVSFADDNCVPVGANANPHQAYVSDAESDDENSPPFNRLAPASHGKESSRSTGAGPASTNYVPGVPGLSWHWETESERAAWEARQRNRGSSRAPSTTSTGLPSYTSERPPRYPLSALGLPRPGLSARQEQGRAPCSAPGPVRPAHSAANTPAPYQYPPEMRTYLDAQLAAQEAQGRAPGGPSSPAPPPRPATGSQGPSSVSSSDTSGSWDDCATSPDASMGSPDASDSPQASPSGDLNVSSTDCFNRDGCVGSKHLTNCKGCVNCSSCQYCEGCVNCSDCRDCVNCVNHKGCVGLIGKVGVSNERA
jgi:hypothetical protein